MTKATFAAALIALGVLGQTAAASAHCCDAPPTRTAWTVAEGYSGYSSTPVPGPGWSWPLLSPRQGCYCFRQHLHGAWRRVEVCS